LSLIVSLLLNTATTGTMAAEGVEGFVLLALMLVIIVLRTIVRWRRVGLGGLELDDYLMPVAGVSQANKHRTADGPRLTRHRYSAPLSRWQPLSS
jgi:hypothetical protein